MLFWGGKQKTPEQPKEKHDVTWQCNICNKTVTHDHIGPKPTYDELVRWIETLDKAFPTKELPQLLERIREGR